MPGLVLPPALETLLQSLQTGHGLSSWQICNSREQTSACTVILKFSGTSTPGNNTQFRRKSKSQISRDNRRRQEFIARNHVKQACGDYACAENDTKVLCDSKSNVNKVSGTFAPISCHTMSQKDTKGDNPIPTINSYSYNGKPALQASTPFESKPVIGKPTLGACGLNPSSPPFIPSALPNSPSLHHSTPNNATKSVATDSPPTDLSDTSFSSLSNSAESPFESMESVFDSDGENEKTVDLTRSDISHQTKKQCVHGSLQSLDSTKSKRLSDNFADKGQSMSHLMQHNNDDDLSSIETLALRSGFNPRDIKEKVHTFDPNIRMVLRNKTRNRRLRKVVYVKEENVILAYSEDCIISYKLDTKSTAWFVLGSCLSEQEKKYLGRISKNRDIGEAFSKIRCLLSCDLSLLAALVQVYA